MLETSNQRYVKKAKYAINHELRLLVGFQDGQNNSYPEFTSSFYM